ncbi:MAG TPA: hypothetical protein VNL91_00605 [Thermoanaerobaculia bacterium]|nr:hypothetical protein [Thermoanaerobaculia bacterium]
MKKTLVLLFASLLLSAQAFGAYIVVLRNGTQYKAKKKWTVQGGKALVELESGQILQLDPALIDEAKSEQMTKLGLGDAKLIDLNPNLPETGTAAKQPSLGDVVKLRQPKSAEPPPAAASQPAPASPAPAPASGKLLPSMVTEKFDRAYENVGMFGNKVTATGPDSIRAEVTADTEDKVFNAISATSFLMLRNAGVDGVTINVVELFMKMTNGGAAGRFRMTRADAEAIDRKQISLQDYFVRHVLY